MRKLRLFNTSLTKGVFVVTLQQHMKENSQ